MKNKSFLILLLVVCVGVFMPREVFARDWGDLSYNYNYVINY